MANGVFDSKVEGYVSNAGFPKYNPTDAKKLVKQYKAAHGGQFEFSYQSTTDQLGIDSARFIKSQLQKVGITVNLPQPVDQPTIINQAIGGQVDTFGWRNYPGLVGDSMYVWFYGTTAGGASPNPVNFNHFNDPQANQALDQARAQPDAGAAQDPVRGLQQALDVTTREFLGLVHAVVHRHEAERPWGPGTEPARRQREDGLRPAESPCLVGYHQLLGLWKG